MFYDLHYYIYFLVVSIITTFEDSLAERNSEKMEKFHIFLLKQTSLHTKPVTLWLLNEELNNNNVSSQLSTSTFTDLKYLPTIRGNQKLGFRHKHSHLVSFIFISFLSDCHTENQLNNKLVETIAIMGNKRKDKFIFIGNSEDCLRQIFKDKTVSGLRKKYGYDYSTGNLLEEPVSFDPSGSMNKLADPSQWKPNAVVGDKFNGRHLRITGTLLPHWLYRISSDESLPMKEQFDGTNFRMFWEASQRYNFTFELHAPEGQSYGELLENGTWLGQVGDLVKKENPYDCAILLGHVLAWFPLLDFAGDLDFAKLEFLTSHPQRFINWEAVLAPFQTHLWILIAFFYLAIVYTFYIILLNGKETSLSSYKSLSTAVEMSYRMALEQNSRVPDNTRHISALWMLSIIIIGTCYKCNLASYLSIPSIISVPTTFRELSERHDYTIILNVLGVAEKKFFEETKSPVFLNIRKRFEETNNTEANPFKCLAKAFLNPKTVCIAWSPLSGSFAQETLTLNPKIEPLVISSEPALPVSMSVAFQKDSVFVDGFTPVTQVVYESGIYHKWAEEVSYVHKLWGREKLLSNREGMEYKAARKLEEEFGNDGFIPFNVNNLKFPFLFLMSGMVVSALVNLIEIAIVWFEY